MSPVSGPESPTYRPGQRWISVSEPELGLGLVRAVSGRTVSIWFPATNDTRQYVASADAPLRRAAFRPGDTVSTPALGEVLVDAVEERGGLRIYTCAGQPVAEADLSHTLTFSGPLKRLFAGQFDPPSVFDLRRRALDHQFERRRSEVRGFVGGRIDLLPHQLGIAAEVTSRLLPRVLLADEVGLGKTIEACLIVHRQLTTGRAQRVLVVVPEALVHQWFLELLRRFNLWFHIFTEARCVAIEDADPGTNPFLDDQLLLCELNLFTDNERRVQQAVDAGWDIVVVDEAHHLAWTPDAPSPAYTAVERLSRVSPGLLLLTATPEQLGLASHFARLRLLDPDRFYSLEQFQHESESYQQIARLAEQLRAAAPLSPDELTTLAAVLDEPVDPLSRDLAEQPDTARAQRVQKLLDQHGTGRVMFRNTRATMAGFPERRPELVSLQVSGSARFKALEQEWQHDLEADTPGEKDDSRVSLTHDARVEWLLGLLQDVAPAKVLLICRTQRKALALEATLRQRTSLPLAAFHEGQTLIQRDRGAAWFADPDGARLLICSEIGSEGRNFQFAHHLVLFDLPLEPGLLEQRIGRLDRIGQREDIHVHLPHVSGTHLDVLTCWYHHGLDAVAHHRPGGRELLDAFQTRLLDLAARAHHDRKTIGPEVDAFIDDVRRAREEVSERLERGRDRLLEWNSLRPAQSTRVVEAIRAQDDDRTLDEFLLATFDAFFVEVEELAPRTYRLGSAGVLVDDFPGLKAEGLTFTRDRQRALLREDLQFVTWDHPLATGALDMLLGSEKGNCAFARWPDAAGSALYLEVLYVLECLAPQSAHADRFLPPTPIRVVVDNRGREQSALALPIVESKAATASGRGVLARDDIRESLLPKLVDRARLFADAQVPARVEAARGAMHEALGAEIARLRDLQKVNRTVRPEEIELLVEQQAALDRYLGASRLRLDAVRLVHRGPQR